VRGDEKKLLAIGIKIPRMEPVRDLNPTKKARLQALTLF